jgi:RimJ/RimL family protein N-acetyltransferase
MPSSLSFDPGVLAEDCPTAETAVRLRRLVAGDAAALAQGLNDFAVAGNLLAAPYPYGIDHAHAFLAEAIKPGRALCAGISVDGELAGVVAIDASSHLHDLGYWLARPFWGRGVMSAATRAFVDLVFAATPVDRLSGGFFVGNEASAAILAKLGFRRSGVAEAVSRARGETVRMITMELDRAVWTASQPEIETPRLTLRPPVLADSDEISLLASDQTIVAMTASVAQPFTARDARGFVLAAARQRRPADLTFSMREKGGGALVGGVGWRTVEPETIELGYWLGESYRGKGLATEAARAALEAGFRLTRAKAAKASCRVVNAGSRRVLERCGFQWEGTGLIRSPALGGSIAVDRFRLERETFQSLRAWAPAAFRNACA